MVADLFYFSEDQDPDPHEIDNLDLYLHESDGDQQPCIWQYR